MLSVEQKRRNYTRESSTVVVKILQESCKGHTPTGRLIPKMRGSIPTPLHRPRRN